MENNNLELVKYSMFLAEEVVENAKMTRYLNECLLIAEGNNNIVNIKAINESFVDSLKNGIKKLIAAIARMWGKFLEGMNNLVKADKNYLDKYRETILKKKMKDYKLTMYKYDVKTLVNASVPALNYGSMRDKLSSDETFISAYFNNYTNPSSKASFVDQVKTKFRGSSEPIEMDSNKINMTDIFNYCYNYDQIRRSLEKDIGAIRVAGNTAIEVINKMARDGEIQESTNIFEDAKYYSHINEGYISINELQVQKVEPNGTSNNQNNNTNTTGNNQQQTKETNPAKANTNISNKDNASNEDDIKNNASNAKEDGDRLNRYLKICGDFLAAKLTISEEIYKEYMSLIKLHVRDYVGVKNDASDTKAKDNGSNYNDNKDKSSGNNDDNMDSFFDKVSKGVKNATDKISKK